MSVDTRDKRLSLICLALPFGRVMPELDGGFNTAAERAQLEFLYSLASEAPTPFNPAWASRVNEIVGPVVGTP